MAMKYYSTETKNFYDTVDALEEAEQAVAKRKQKENEHKLARTNAAKKVEDAYAEYVAAEKKYVDELSAFCKEYGYYHKSISSDNIDGIESFINAVRRLMLF